jgi:hypothetical protein
VNVPPMIGRDIGSIDAERLDGIDHLQHTLDLGPAAAAQQDFTAGSDKRQCLVWLQVV